jgi:hypothetical protein
LLIRGLSLAALRWSETTEVTQNAAATAAAIKKIRLTRKANLSGNSFLEGGLSSWRAL